MAPLKLEDHIKEKLEDRRIIPSANAWDKLEAQLDAQSKMKKKRHNKIVAVLAASVIALLMLSPLLKFLNKENSEVKTVNVIVPKNDLTSSRIDESMLVENSNEKEFNSNDESKNRIEDKTEKPKLSTLAHVKNKEISIRKEKEINKNQEISESITHDNSTITDSLLNNKIENKVANLLAQIQQKERNNEQVTDEEIDNLLREAQFEITANKLLVGNKTNALSLLEDVESELDETFKQRVFDALKTSFNKFRTAVVERDN